MMRALIVGATLAGFAACQPGTAATFDIIYSGTISAVNGSTPGAPFKVDDAFTSTIRYDDSLGGLMFNNAYRSLYGGSSYGTISPATSVTFASPGYTLTFKPVVSGDLRLTGGYQIETSTAVDSNTIFMAQVIDLNSSLPVTFTDFVTMPDPASSGMFFVSGGGTFTTLDLSIKQVALSSSVPEPASWMLLVAGFGLTGWSLRRRSGGLAVHRAAIG